MKNSYYLIVVPGASTKKEMKERLESAKHLYELISKYNKDILILVAGIGNESMKKFVREYLSSNSVGRFYIEEESETTQQHYTTKEFQKLYSLAKELFITTSSKGHAFRNSKILKDMNISGKVSYSNSSFSLYEILALASYLIRGKVKNFELIHNLAKKYFTKF